MEIAKAPVAEAGGKGDFLLVSGIAGTASSESFDTGAKRAFEQTPDARLIGRAWGTWINQVARTEVQKLSAINPAQVDGIVVQGSRETGILKTVLQPGRDVMPVALAKTAAPRAGYSPRWT